MRIVSLLGSATEIVCALGLEPFLVGISHECDHPATVHDLPRVSRPRFDPSGLSSGEIDAAVRRCMEEYGSVYGVDRELLARLQPTLVLTQDVCEVCAVPTQSARDAIHSLPIRPEVLSLDAHTVGQILATISAVADAADAHAPGEALLQDLQRRLERVAEKTRGMSRPRVLLLEWLDPLFAPGHWVPEMVEAAGGECLVGSAGARSFEMTADELSGLEPDVLLIEPCGYDVSTAAKDATQHRSLLEGLAPTAIRTGRAWSLDSGWFSRSGPRVIDGIEVLAGIPHPEAFPLVDPRVAVRWA